MGFMSQATMPTTNATVGEPRKFVLDTDIGTDVDDLLALSMALGSPELSIAAITTGYGDVELRARIAAKAYGAANRLQPPIAPGLSETLSGRAVWWPGHEGSTIVDLHDQTYSSVASARDLLKQSAVVAAIGPLTNIADAVMQSGARIEQVVIMGGEFERGIVEHNIRCDSIAADVLFSSGIPVLAIGLEQTERVRLGRDELNRSGEAGPLGALVSNEMKRFWEFADQDYNVPHDPIAILALARPDLFEISAGVVTVHTRGADEGRTDFVRDARGPHSIVTDMDVDAVAREITDRILVAASFHASTAQL